jgi:hypothetical protein
MLVKIANAFEQATRARRQPKFLSAYARILNGKKKGFSKEEKGVIPKRECFAKKNQKSRERIENFPDFFNFFFQPQISNVDNNAFS